MHLHCLTETLVARVERLTWELEEARAWARGYASGMWLFDTTDPPDWLYDRFDEHGEPCDADGNSLPPEVADPRLF